ncbi:MAG: class I SAM-dependent methyltransferase [Flavobacteriales bacterium]|nr:class I SAM-dependent methyltransferase [Flavobacteriales bacterium]
MLSKEHKTQLRADLFRHLDGVVTAPTAIALENAGVLTYLLERRSSKIDEISEHFKANEGYLNVALRILCSQGWLTQKIDNRTDVIVYETNDKSSRAFSLVHLYRWVVELMKLGDKYHERKFEKEPFLVLERAFNEFKSELESSPTRDETPGIKKQVMKHIEGILLGPTLVKLAMGGMFHKYFMQASFKAEEFHKDSESFERLLDILTYFGWFEKKGHTFSFTDKGMFFARRASAYGVTVSYSPTLRMLDEIIFGNPVAAKNAGDGSKEGHVDRAMNVWGSGGAHSSYFKVVDEIIIELFNRPISEQPKGILDMGCGNGAFIQHLFQVIENQTRRGEILEEHPLILVGADYNEAALEITKQNLIQADIWAKVVFGDIGDPEGLAEKLRTDYRIELNDLLNVRTFLDHNRIWKEPIEVDPNRISDSTGAFAFEGKRLGNNLVEESLLQHFKGWQPFVSKFGLLVIELHTVHPYLVSQNLGKTAATAYDATHGYSDQYIVEVEVFKKIAQESGLKSDERYFRRYPNNDLATVTINLFKA